jgi:predicted alpha/beta-hydrolase family hydrolase
VEHWDRVTCPVLLVQGNRDPFGTPEEFGIHLPALAGPVTQSWLDGGHDPPRRHDRLIVATAAAWLAGSDPDPSGQAG